MDCAPGARYAIDECLAAICIMKVVNNTNKQREVTIKRGYEVIDCVLLAKMAEMSIGGDIPCRRVILLLNGVAGRDKGLELTWQEFHLPASVVVRSTNDSRAICRLRDTMSYN